MKYYIFQVKDSIGQNYYIINNKYLGYIGLDGDEIRGLIESKITRKYRLFASGDVKDHYNLHNMFCKDIRLKKSEAVELVKDYKLKLNKTRKWYEVVLPNPHSSESRLCEVGTFNMMGKFFDER